MTDEQKTKTDNPGDALGGCFVSAFASLMFVGLVLVVISVVVGDTAFQLEQGQQGESFAVLFITMFFYVVCVVPVAIGYAVKTREFQIVMLVVAAILFAINFLTAFGALIGATPMGLVMLAGVVAGIGTWVALHRISGIRPEHQINQFAHQPPAPHFAPPPTGPNPMISTPPPPPPAGFHPQPPTPPNAAVGEMGVESTPWVQPTATESPDARLPKSTACHLDQLPSVPMSACDVAAASYNRVDNNV